MVTIGQGRRRPKLGQKVAYQFPVFGPGLPTLFWAENGLVVYEDRRDATPEHKRCGSITWDEAAKRVLAISYMIIRSSEDPRWGFERRRMQRFISDMEEVLREAKSHGGPFDASLGDRGGRVMPVAFDADMAEMIEAARQAPRAPVTPETEVVINPDPSALAF